jgi:hypothetical protein
MDDSERSYGYSEDIYHGRRGAGGDYGRFDYDRPGGRSFESPRFYPERGRREGSYEYGPEPGGMDGGVDRDLSPEEAAMRIEGGAFTERGARSGRRGGSYDYGRGTEYSGVESFTWDVPGPHSGRGPKGYRRSDDRIHEEICDRLEAHGEVDASDIEVKVENGEVTLGGTVRDRHMKRTAERVVDSVRGVVDVHNQLRLAREGGEALKS